MTEYRFYGWQNADVKPLNKVFVEIDNPRALYTRLSKIWCADTCAPRLRSMWSNDNMTLGQCSVTAFLAQDIFGGKVYGIERSGGNFHCYNVVGNCVFDLTSEQFGDEKLDYSPNSPEQFREVHFSKQEKYERYLHLKKAVFRQFHIVSNNVRCGFGRTLIDGELVCFAYHGYPARNDDFFTNAEISADEYVTLCRRFQKPESYNSEQALAFRKQYVDGRKVLLEGMNELL